MSDLSKFLPKSYQKDSVEDQMIKPIDSLNIPKNSSSEKPAIDPDLKPLGNLQLNNNFPSLDNNSSNNDQKDSKKKDKKIKQKGSSEKKKTTLLLILLLFFLVGSGAGLILMKQRQDTRQEAYGESFCGPANYGSYCKNGWNATWHGRCVLIYCPLGNEIGPGCSENDREARWEFGPCTELLDEARNDPEVPGCWQVDAVDESNVYCDVNGCKSYELDISQCGDNPPTVPPTNPPTVPPTVPPTNPPTVPPTDTPRISCGGTGCMTDSQCASGFVCINIGNTGICGLDNLADSCRTHQTYEACCAGITNTPVATNTPIPTNTPTTIQPSPTPIITQVITTVGCNESCNENADCTNISHICYESLCRLDVNPTDVNCRLPDGGNVIERAVTVPTETGFAEWFNFLKVGLGILGLGALLMLLL